MCCSKYESKKKKEYQRFHEKWQKSAKKLELNYRATQLQCGFANFPPARFRKNFVKLTFSLKSCTVNQFDDKFFSVGEKFQNYHTVSVELWKRRQKHAHCLKKLLKS